MRLTGGAGSGWSGGCDGCGYVARCGWEVRARRSGGSSSGARRGRPLHAPKRMRKIAACGAASQGADGGHGRRDGGGPGAGARAGLHRRHQVNPAAALRGPGGWHIIARLAKYDDIEALATAITADIIAEHAAAVAEVSFREATERLYCDVEALVRDAHPIVAALPPDQLRRMLEEARRSDGTGVPGGVPGGGAEELPRGVLGRKLALAGKVHALVVKEFNRDLGIRTRSAAAANLTQSRAQRLAERAAKAAGGVGDSSSGEGGGNGRSRGSLGGGSRGGAPAFRLGGDGVAVLAGEFGSE